MLIKMFFDFQKKISNEYFTNFIWKNILSTIFKNEILENNAANLSFSVRSISFEIDQYMKSRSETSETSTVEDIVEIKLIYHVNNLIDLRRLCISSNCVKDILSIVHEQDHSNFARCLEIIFKAWYVRELIRHLRVFIRHCSECLVLQIRRHSLYENLQLIDSSSLSFHIITLDFIFALSLTREEWDTIMSIIDKFTKRIILISRKKTFNAKNWALLLLKRLNTVDWEYSKIIITDRDRKFLSELWKTIFDKLDIKLLYSTSYHSQTNEASERINQTIEIALKFFIHDLQNASIWSQILFKFQALNNNVNSSATEKTSNEIAYNFTSNRFLDLLFDTNVINFSHNRIKTRDAISWTNMKYKHHYDKRHTSLFMKEDDWTLIKVHKNYSISSTLDITKKLSQQYVDSFQMINRIDRLAYKLDIFNDWKIHAVFFVTQLKSSLAFNADSYQRFKSIYSSSMFVESDTNEMKSYEIDRLLNKRTIKRERNQSVEYLIRWKEYDLEWDRWYNVKDLDDANDLINDYEKAIELESKWGHLTFFSLMGKL